MWRIVFLVQIMFGRHEFEEARKFRSVRFSANVFSHKVFALIPGCTNFLHNASSKFIGGTKLIPSLAWPYRIFERVVSTPVLGGALPEIPRTWVDTVCSRFGGTCTFSPCMFTTRGGPQQVNLISVTSHLEIHVT